MNSFKIFFEKDYTAELEAQNKRKEVERTLKNTLTNHYSKLEKHSDLMHSYTTESFPLNNYHWNKHAGKQPTSHQVINHFEKQTSSMDSALSEHKTPHAFTVYSKSRHDPRELKNENDVVHHPAYLSTSIHKHVVESPEFFDRNRSNTQGEFHHHYYNIQVPEGHHGAYISHITNNHYGEFILPRGTNLKYKGTTTQKDMISGNRHNYHYHQLEVM